MTTPNGKSLSSQKSVNDAVRELIKEANALTAKATGIENAVYDLKAVNPEKTSDTDTRTPEELLDIIAAKGRRSNPF